MYRLKEGIERFMITDINNPAGSAMAQSTIPAYMDGISTPERPNGVVRLVSAWIPRFNHVPGGSNVLYMNGHVEFLKFPGKFPTTKFITIYGQLGAGNTSMNSTPFSLSGF